MLNPSDRLRISGVDLVVSKAFRLAVHVERKPFRRRVRVRRGVSKAFRLAVHVEPMERTKCLKVTKLVSKAFRLAVHVELECMRARERKRKESLKSLSACGSC